MGDCIFCKIANQILNFKKEGFKDGKLYFL